MPTPAWSSDPNEAVESLEVAAVRFELLQAAFASHDARRSALWNSSDWTLQADTVITEEGAVLDGYMDALTADLFVICVRYDPAMVPFRERMIPERLWAVWQTMPSHNKRPLFPNGTESWAAFWGRLPYSIRAHMRVALAVLFPDSIPAELCARLSAPEVP